MPVEVSVEQYTESSWRVDRRRRFEGQAAPHYAGPRLELRHVRDRAVGFEVGCLTRAAREAELTRSCDALHHVWVCRPGEHAVELQVQPERLVLARVDLHEVMPNRRHGIELAPFGEEAPRPCAVRRGDHPRAAPWAGDAAALPVDARLTDPAFRVAGPARGSRARRDRAGVRADLERAEARPHVGRPVRDTRASARVAPAREDDRAVRGDGPCRVDATGPRTGRARPLDEDLEGRARGDGERRRLPAANRDDRARLERDDVAARRDEVGADRRVDLGGRVANVAPGVSGVTPGVEEIVGDVAVDDERVRSTPEREGVREPWRRAQPNRSRRPFLGLLARASRPTRQRRSTRRAFTRLQPYVSASDE